jgi:hypothetical protein
LNGTSWLIRRNLELLIVAVKLLRPLLDELVLVGVPILRLTLAVKASGLSLSALLEGSQNLDRSPRLLFGKPQFVKTLQIQPKLGARAKEMTKAQGCVTSNGALSIQNPGNAIGWHL